MSELIETGAPDRKDVLKRLILDLHAGTTPDVVQRQLVRLLGQVPYGLVVEVEQELVEDGMPPEEVTRLCHLHSAALSGAIDTSLARRPPPGHPAQILSAENAALLREAGALLHLCGRIEVLADGDDAGPDLLSARVRVNALADVEKHYQRKEHLLFPFLEAHGITAPPQVMWGKHDEARALLRGALAALASASGATAARAIAEGSLQPFAEAIRDMVDKEEKILLPMCLDVLEEREWWEIARQSDELGWCLVEPEAEWRPAGVAVDEAAAGAGKVRLPTGTLAHAQLEAILGALPLDATFVDAEDRVRWFSHGKDRVFSRSRAVLGRKVQLCHPPSSVGTVERILDGFKAGTHDTAAFWIQHRERFVHIEYRALRGADGGYLGCLEMTQDLTEKRALQGEQRLLAWQAPTAPEPQPARTPADGHGCAHATAGGPTAAAPPSGPRPAWVEAVRVVSTLDARPLLATGAHPVGQVMAALGGLAEGEAFVLVTPFVPGPLLEKAQAIGCVAHSEAGAAGEFRTWFGRVG
ncbi:DUF438 domain-containing protein [Anaeromyxobacter oryzae]|uniref:Hemerythrin HHE cation binding domain protein n=1 Tax=Anaeromyxobacter oryzae TaxID=2918170 RepID=A0ABN6MPS2_9BACT|nr:DUF438 domain-containing protein [Anaeromyxobacter oryzae]BDG03021.1 hypothetical protein AMOR_20170 [Anaeromyxobacter oryzae]